MSFRTPPRYLVKKALLKMQDQATELQRSIEWALRTIEEANEICIYHWRCVNCGHVAKYTRPVTVKACGPCEKCKLTRWVPDGEGKAILPD